MRFAPHTAPHGSWPVQTRLPCGEPARWVRAGKRRRRLPIRLVPVLTTWWEYADEAAHRRPTDLVVAAVCDHGDHDLPVRLAVVGGCGGARRPVLPRAD